MRIVHIAAGAGGMYCGACARDLSLARGLIAKGHDVQLIPLYTPLRSDLGESAPSGPLFYSGVTVFLRQASRLFRRTPRVVDRLLSSPRLLGALSRFAIEVRAEKLGPMTLSVLAGRDGAQAAELEQLLAHLEGAGRPDVVSLTNSLLSGIAPEVKRRLGVPVVCSLQGEESFIGGIPEPYRSRAMGLLRENARAVDLFVAPSEEYALGMAGFLEVPVSRVAVVRPGIDAAAYRRPGAAAAPPYPPNVGGVWGGHSAAPFTLGFLSVIIPGKGLDLLVDALAILVKERGRDVRLRAAGKVLNRRYWREVSGRVRSAGLSAHFDYLGEVDFAGKLALLHGSHVFCVPSRIRETRGIAAMEALAAGVPVVAPMHGVFPDLLGRTGGGLVVPNEAPALADAVERLMDHPEERERMGRAGAEGIARDYTREGMADALLESLEQARRSAVAAAR